MKRLFKVIPILLLIVSLFSCNTTKGQVANNNSPTTGNGTIELRDLDWVNIMGRYLIRNGMSEEDIHNWYKNVTEQ